MGYGVKQSHRERLCGAVGEASTLPAFCSQNVRKEHRMTFLIASLHTRLATRDRGATAVEYGLLVALIAAVIVVVVKTLGTNVSTAFTSISDNI
jgi:pilus assembly protein Flp/PilA